MLVLDSADQVWENADQVYVSNGKCRPDMRKYRSNFFPINIIRNSKKFLSADQVESYLVFGVRSFIFMPLMLHC